MEKGEYLLDEDELVGRTTAGHAEADDHGGPEEDRVVASAEGEGEEAGGHRREEEVEAKILEGRQRGEIRENVLRGRESGHRVRRGRESSEGHGFGVRMPSRRTKLAVAMVALGVVGAVGFWWAHGRSEVARGTNTGSGSEAMAGLPPELAKVLRSGSAVAIRHSALSHAVPVVPVGRQSPAGGKQAGGNPLIGQHRVVAVAGKAILVVPGSSLVPVGIPVPALAGGKALLAGESSRSRTLAPTAKDTVLEEIRSLKVEMAGVKAALANERKAVGALPDMDKRLVVLHGALEKLLKNAEAGAHAKVRSGKKGKVHAGSRRVKRVMGYRLLAVVGDQAVVEDMGTGRVKVLRANGRLGGLVVYQVTGGAVVTNYGVMGGSNE